MADTKVDFRTRLNLTKEQLVEDRNLFKKLYRVEEVGPVEVYKANKETLPKVENFLEHLYKAGMPKTSIRNMETILEWNYEHPTQTKAPEYSEGTTTMTGAPEAPVSGTTAQGLRESQEAIRAERESSDLASRENAQKIVNEGLKKQQEIYDQRIKAAEAAKAKIEKETKYVRVTEKPAEKEQLKEARAKFVEEVKKDPVSQVDVIYKNLKQQVGDQIPDEAIQLTAVYAVASTQVISPEVKETITETWIKENPEYASWASPLADQSKSLHDLAKEVAVTALGPDQTLVPEYNVSFSETPGPDFQPVSLGFIPIQSANLAQKAQSVLANGGPPRPDFMITELERQLEIAQKGVQGAPKSLDESMVQGYFTTYTSFHKPSVSTVTPTEWSAKINAASGTSEISGLVSGLAKAGVQKVAGKVTAQVVAKTGLKAAISKLTAAAGSVGGPLGTFLGWLGGEVIAKVVDKIPWDKIKRWSLAAIGVVTVGVGLVLGIPAVTLFGAGVGLFGGAVASGATAASVGSGLTSLLGAFGSATLGAIGVPILFTLLGFPVIVALILFIINSGAYVVPPGSLTGVVDIVCSTQNGEKNPQTTGSPAADAAACIVSNLTQFHLNPLLEGLLGSAGWKRLENVLPGPAIDALAASAPVDGHLQCVGFVAATAGYAYGKAFDQNNACTYIGNPPGGYTYISGTTGIKSGDFFLINGSDKCKNGGVNSPGHIGVVISVDGALISCADANSIGPGVARSAHGCFALSQITGYLRKH